ncbi:hypothetical protein [Actinomadura sp. 6N118]|uniref:hypothetical protein n=1 Tax=Actinomadura sp. 6N118 TaxID=3375151 RepID=UPI0037B7A529
MALGIYPIFGALPAGIAMAAPASAESPGPGLLPGHRFLSSEGIRRRWRPIKPVGCRNHV